MAIESDGTGDVTDSKVAWETNRGVPYIPSLLLDGERLFAVNDQGIMTCLNASNGKRVWQKRLGGNVSASPVLVNDLLYVAAEDGHVFVLRAADKFELVATNDLGEELFATPAIAGGQMFLRGQQFLYCIGASAAGSHTDRDLARP